MEKNITVLIKEPNRPAYYAVIPNELSALQKVVHGYIEVFDITTDLAIICNECVRIFGLEPNVSICGQLFVGPIMLVRIDGEEFASVDAFPRENMLQMFPQLFEGGAE